MSQVSSRYRTTAIPIRLTPQGAALFRACFQVSNHSTQGHLLLEMCNLYKEKLNEEDRELVDELMEDSLGARSQKSSAAAA